MKTDGVRQRLADVGVMSADVFRFVDDSTDLAEMVLRHVGAWSESESQEAHDMRMLAMKILEDQ